MFCWISHSSGNTYSVIIMCIWNKPALRSEIATFFFLPGTTFRGTDFSESGFRPKECLELEKKQLLLGWGRCKDCCLLRQNTYSRSWWKSCVLLWGVHIFSELNFASLRNLYNTLATCTRTDHKALFRVFYCRFIIISLLPYICRIVFEN